MTNATHTPAPWDWQDGFLIGDLDGDGGDVSFTAIANARLIAAAPDLLAALRAVTDCLLGFHASDDFGPSDTEALNAAIAAIAKARA